MKIAIDAMGGDFAPQAPVKGALLAREKYPDVEIILVGQESAIQGALREIGWPVVPAGITIQTATEVVEIADDPATAFKKKPDSSLTVGLNLVKNGEADGFVSAGSTGALLAGATLVVKRIRGLRRAALAPTIPTANGRAVLLISLELEEVMNVPDRILVMYEGEIVGELDPKKTTVEELGLFMAGAKRNVSIDANTPDIEESEVVDTVRKEEA